MLPVAGDFGIPATKVEDRSWSVSTVYAPVEWGRFASLGFGADGRAVVSHGSRYDWISYDLAITLCRDQTCETSTTRIQPWRVSDHTSMATGADWLPVWSFHDSAGGRLVVGRCTDASCSSVSFSVLDPPVTLPPGQRSDAGILGSTAIAANENPIVMYMTTDPTRGLWIAQCFDAACSAANLEPVDINHGDFHRFDVAVGTDGLPIYAVFDSSHGPFAVTVGHCADYTCFTGTTTQVQTWTGDYQGWGFPSVAIGTDGLPIIAYNDLTVSYDGEALIHNESVKVAHCLNVECTSSKTSTIAKERADFVSIDIGGNGLPIVAYHAGGQVKVAACKDLACTSAKVVTVDAGPGVGLFTSLATDPLGMPMLAYFDEANHNLKVARLGS
jgi:hypothetical protein